MPQHDAQFLRLLKTARGQMDGLIRMVEEERYCIDISNQIMATQALLSRANRDLLQAHLNTCVRHAFLSGNEEEQSKKIAEIMDVMAKLTK